jgi:hypothetical protein
MEVATSSAEPLRARATRQQPKEAYMPFEQEQTHPDTNGQENQTPEEVDEALQEAMRRQAATREETPPDEHILDSASEQGMGPQGPGHGRRSGKHS